LSTFYDINSGFFQDDPYEGSQGCSTSLVAGTEDFVPFDEVFAPASSTCGNWPSFATLSPGVVQYQQEIPIPPDISPLLRSSRVSAEEQAVLRVPTPPDITPLLKGALSSANIQLPLTSTQSSSVSALQIIMQCRM